MRRNFQNTLKKLLLLALGLISVWATLNSFALDSSSTTEKQPLRHSSSVTKAIHCLNDLTTAYPALLACSHAYNPWNTSMPNNETVIVASYAVPAESTTQQLRIVRAVLVYFPIESVENFMPEFKWLVAWVAEVRAGRLANWSCRFHREKSRLLCRRRQKRFWQAQLQVRQRPIKRDGQTHVHFDWFCAVAKES